MASGIVCVSDATDSLSSSNRHSSKSYFKSILSVGVDGEGPPTSGVVVNCGGRSSPCELLANRRETAASGECASFFYATGELLSK